MFICILIKSIKKWISTNDIHLLIDFISMQMDIIIIRNDIHLHTNKIYQQMDIIMDYNYGYHTDYNYGYHYGL